MSLVVTIADVEYAIQHDTLRITAAANARHTLNCELLSLDGSYRPALDDEIVVAESEGTSSTSMTIGVGSRSMVTQAGRHFVVGERIRVWRTAAPTNWMEGQVTQYVGTGLDMLVTVINGAANTDTDWQIGWRIFGGLIDNPPERGFGNCGASDAIVTRISATDFNGLPDRRAINVGFIGGTIKQVLQVLVTYLTPFGVILHPDQVDGPTWPASGGIPPLSFIYMNLRAGLNLVAQWSNGFVYDIDYYEQLRMYLPASMPAPFNIVTGDGHALGDITVEPTRYGYVNRVLLLYDQGTKLATAETVPPTPDSDLWEIILERPDTQDPTLAQAMAQIYLDQHLPTTKRVTYQTTHRGLQPGRTQTINVARRNLNNICLIVEVITEDRGGILWRTVTALEGSLYQTGWREIIEQWGGGGGGTVMVGGGGGGGGGVVTASRYRWLGGSGAGVRSSAPTWVPAGDAQVIYDTVAVGSTVTVVVRLRARAGSVTPRLYNVSDGTAAGTGAPVSPAWPAWQMAAPFPATLTPGSKLYELQLLPSVANSDVIGVGYSE